jgi:hypothetical protein
MTTLDSKYIPKAKGKNKIKKAKRVVAAPSFPTPIRQVETKPLKKKSPFGDHYVWSK